MAAIINDLGIEVLTPTGYQSFSAINEVIKPARTKIELLDGTVLEASLNHPFMDKNGVFVLAKNFIVGEAIQTVTGLHRIVSIEYILEESVLYDLLDVGNGHAYYTNGAVSHNCEFITSDPVLIDSRHAREMLAACYAPDEIDEKNFKIWGRLNRSRYLVGADVSEGLGKDFSTIQVFCGDTLEQVAEMRDQNCDEAGTYEALKHIFKKLLRYKDPRTGKPPEILWSYENNAQGKVISTLYDRDMDFPDVELVTVGEKRGMQTNVATKADASKLFKKLIEQLGGYKIKSKELVEEIQNYVRATNQGTYRAKTGSTDDLISSTLIVTRIMKYLAAHDDVAFDILYRGLPAGETDNTPGMDQEPMPMGVL